ncbi:hypothetical protein CC86DRAFT_36101 [Ophiobolus disseminans]|uniref:Rhodopsin domain-containing protein n=1 Tax=Ophiobolus disseminans TaxID=1469910 RepID=A0A6A6ZYX4_9PLEO|nr:hypothetical protein CC86DRAFT_36101 [Ophiobolus disseminans]
MIESRQQQHWPNRGGEVLGSTVPIGVLSTGVLIWRMLYGIKTRKKLFLGDCLLILATLLNIAATVIRFKTTHYGLGRHFSDPSVNINKFGYFLWVGAIVNLLAVALLKYSICAYLLALKFSRIYLAIVWASILTVTTCNLLIPMLSFFSCTPFEANYNKGLRGKCFLRGGQEIVLTQGISNIITDVIYVVAPLIYLSTIKLPRRTQWGLRIVFCLGLVATACSIVKTTEFRALSKTKDPSWDSVNLAIWSATELSVGILCASLPPLRKQFDRFFQVILPSTAHGSMSRPPDGIPMWNVSKTIGSKSIGRSRGCEEDDDSERGILPNEEGGNGITKTVVHEVISEDRDEVIQEPARTRQLYGENRV